MDAKVVDDGNAARSEHQKLQQHKQSQGNKRLMTQLYVLAVLDLMSISTLLPSFRDLFASYDIGLVEQNYVGSASAMVAFFMAPLLGRASDTWGRVSNLMHNHTNANVRSASEYSPYYSLSTTEAALAELLLLLAIC